MKFYNPKVTIDGHEFEVCSIEIETIELEVAKEWKSMVKPPFDKINTCGAFEFQLDPAEPLSLMFEPDLTDWPYLPLVRISPQRVSEILFSHSR